MDANSLKAFLTIVDQGSFSEAAETLHLTQPAISKRLAALESPEHAGVLDSVGGRMIEDKCPISYLLYTI